MCFIRIYKHVTYVYIYVAPVVTQLFMPYWKIIWSQVIIVTVHLLLLFYCYARLAFSLAVYASFFLHSYIRNIVHMYWPTSLLCFAHFLKVLDCLVVVPLLLYKFKVYIISCISLHFLILATTFKLLQLLEYTTILNISQTDFLFIFPYSIQNLFNLF